MKKIFSMSLLLVILVLFGGCFDNSQDITSEEKEIQKKLDRLEKEDKTKLQSFNYTRVSEHIIKDNKTGLIWQDNDDAKSIERNWYDAKRYCENLVLDGYSEWRLPSISELGVVMFDKKEAFKHTNNSGAYLSSDFTNEEELTTAIDSDGDFMVRKNSKCNVRCVK